MYIWGMLVKRGEIYVVVCSSTDRERVPAPYQPLGAIGTIYVLVLLIRSSNLLFFEFCTFCRFCRYPPF